MCIGTALLLLLAFIVLESIEAHLEGRRSDVAVAMNLVGRQRMHSQALVRLALQTEHSHPELRRHYLEHFKHEWSVLSGNQTMLHAMELPHVPRHNLVTVNKKLEKAGGSFTSLEKSVERFITRLDGLEETAIPQTDGLGAKLLTECDKLAESLGHVEEEIALIGAGTSTSFKLVGWLRIAMAGVIMLIAVFLLSRGQVATLKRLINTSKRFEELTYLQNAVLESTAYSIISTTPEGVIVTFNRGAEILTGYSRDEMIGVHTPQMIHDAAEIAQAAAEVSAELEFETAPGFEVLAAPARRGLVREREWTYVKKNGDRVPVSLSMTAMWGPETTITGFLAVAGDITEKKEFERQFLRAQRIESIGTLAGGIAHDLNNVLTPILMSIELLRLTSSDARSRDILTNIESSAKRGADMVRQILSFARGVEGERSLISAGRIISDIQKLVQETFPKHIRCAATVPDDLPAFLGDPTQLHQILLNLCLNARDAMLSGGTLTLSAESITLDESAAAMHMDAKAGSYVSISVKDTGSGIPTKVLGKIFDPFFTTKGVGKGTGLGLSTVLAISKSHGGFVQVASEPGEGTTFTVCLPVATQAEPIVIKPILEMPLERGNGELILIVDDENNILRITRQMLEAQGYRTLVAANGMEAVAIYRRQSHEIAAVLTDMMMPIMAGPDTIKELQRINPAVKIIAASGITHNDGPARAVAMGIRDFLPKPYSARTVVNTLHKVLQKQAA